VPEETANITDLATLRAIANPVRLQIYEQLTSHGPATATHLSQRLGMAPNALSYHLRQLATHGFVEQGTGSSDQRERWWQAVPGGLRWRREDFKTSPGAAEVLATAERLLVQRQLDRLGEWMERGKSTWGSDWVSAASSSDSLLWLTRSELDQMTAEVEALINRWVDFSREKRTHGDDSDRAPVFSLFHAFPFHDGSSG
jgi:DNA-binding transcriptional ArsR family regulator